MVNTEKIKTSPKLRTFIKKTKAKKLVSSEQYNYPC